MYEYVIHPDSCACQSIVYVLATLVEYYLHHDISSSSHSLVGSQKSFPKDLLYITIPC